MDVSLIEAVRAWWAGSLDSHAQMMGLPIFWWERVGKLMIFAGGFTVVLDIVGPQKVRRFGRRLRDWLTITDAMKEAAYSWLFFSERFRFKQWSVSQMRTLPSRSWFGRLPAGWRSRIGEFLDDVLRPDVVERRLDEVETESHGLSITLAMVVLVVVVSALMGIAAERWDGMFFLMWFSILCVGYLAVFLLLTWLLDAFTPVAMSAALVLSSAMALVLDAVIDMLADVLESRENDVLLKGAGVLLFVLGSGLDLLGG